MPVKFPPPKGFVASGFEQVLEEFSKSFAQGLDKGASFAAYYKGEPVVNIWGGLADEEAKRPWKEETMGFFHSTTKFVASVVIAQLVERGLLNYSEKIATYWPEFAQNGKENITLEMLMSYRAGLAALSDNFEIGWIRDDPRRLHDQLAKQKPLWTPDESHGYSPHAHGLYLSEIVKRVDKKGRSLSEYFADEIAKPFGMDFYIGLPKHLQYRAARLEPVPLSKEKLEERLAGFKGDPKIYVQAFSQPKDWFSSRKLNDPDFMELPIPSAHGVGTALAMAKFSGILANGGKHEGKTLLSPISLALLQEPLSHGIDLTMSNDEITGRGTWLIPVVEGSKAWFMYGHAGYGDQCSAADPYYRVGWAYTTNYLNPNVSFDSTNRWRPLIKVLFECIHRQEGVTVERRLLTSYEELEKEKRSGQIKSML